MLSLLCDLCERGNPLMNCSSFTLFCFCLTVIELFCVCSLPVPRVPRHLIESNVYITLMFRYRCVLLLSSPPSPMQNIVGAFSRKIDTDFHQINCSREGCTQQRVLKCVCVLQVAPSTLVPRPATPSTPATLISSNKQLKIKIKNFLLPPLWLCGRAQLQRERGIGSMRERENGKGVEEC